MIILKHKLIENFQSINIGPIFARANAAANNNNSNQANQGQNNASNAMNFNNNMNGKEKLVLKC